MGGFERFFGREPLYFSRNRTSHLTPLDLSAGSYILMYMKYFPIAEFRANISKIIDSSTESHDRVVITRNGEPAAILLNIEDYESMTETLEIASDPALYKEIMDFIENPNGQPLYSTEEIQAVLASRREAESE
jgi:prevent-host-death family protein